jgi:hypothetical protein
MERMAGWQATYGYFEDAMAMAEEIGGGHDAVNAYVAIYRAGR